VVIPLVSIVRLRGDKLVHEHVYWDQASVLVQVGLLDAKFGGSNLPAIDTEQAQRLLDA
jgi:carboxymethylenebutenolidase